MSVEEIRARTDCGPRVACGCAYPQYIVVWLRACTRLCWRVDCFPRACWKTYRQTKTPPYSRKKVQTRKQYRDTAT